MQLKTKKPLNFIFNMDDSEHILYVDGVYWDDTVAEDGVMYTLWWASSDAFDDLKEKWRLKKEKSLFT